MIEAEMYNKIPKLETWEDILTSNVFGLLDLINNKYLLEIILNAKNINGDFIEDKLKNKKIKNVELWKKFKNIGEPDIVVTLDDNTFFIIEVKYFSHEHNAKLAIKQEDSIQEKEQGQLAKYLNIEIDNKKSDFIIYLTQDYQSLKVIQNSDEEKPNSKSCIDGIYHIHWDEVNELLVKIKNLEGIEKNIINKIIEYLNFKGFTYWEGFKYRDEFKGLNTNIGGFYER